MKKIRITILAVTISVGTIQAQTTDCSIGVVHAHINQDLGNASGGIQLSVEGSTAEHTYKWSNGETSGSLHNIAEGSYEVVISNDVGCKKKLNFFVPGTTLLSESTGRIDFQLSPVPTTGNLHLAIDENISGKRVRIFDSMGKLVMLKEYAKDFNVTRLPAGLYYFEVEDGNRVTGRRKFIKV